MLEFRNLSVGYGKKPIIRDICLSLPSPSVTTLIGVNGCGKSTLLKSVIGLSDILSGDILLDGRPTSGMKPNETARKIAYLPQGKDVPDMTVGKLVLHGRFPYLHYPRVYGKQDRERAWEAMETMGISRMSEVNLRKLSGGERQKAYMAMALCQGADIILLDEPTTYLDLHEQLKVLHLMGDLKNRGKTILTVSHDIPSALKYSDRIAVMDKGTIVMTGSPAEILESRLIESVFHVRIQCWKQDGKPVFDYEEAEG